MPLLGPAILHLIPHGMHWRGAGLRKRVGELIKLGEKRAKNGAPSGWDTPMCSLLRTTQRSGGGAVVRWLWVHTGTLVHEVAAS